MRQKWQLNAIIHLSARYFICPTSILTNYALQSPETHCVCVRFHTLLQPLHVRLPHVIRAIISSLAYAATCRLRYASNEASALTDRQLLAELIMAYPEHTTVYTGLPMSGCAVVCEAQVIFRLHSYKSVYAAKLYTIYRTLLFIHCQTRRCHLLSRDCRSGL